MAERRNWTRDETLLAFRLYCYTPFGKLHAGNPDIIDLAERLGRTPGAVGMKACNFASLDPLHQARGVVGLKNRSKLEEQIWEEFLQDPSAIAAEAEAFQDAAVNATAEPTAPVLIESLPSGPSDIERTIRVRRVQRFFRRAVLSSYGRRCALTGLAVPSLLNASHIMPWSVDESRRADPTNDLCLNSLHDRVFDRGLITFDDEFQVVISPQLRKTEKLGQLALQLKDIEGQRLAMPERFGPSPEALAYHRDNIFDCA